jgi:hypothetical protein
MTFSVTMPAMIELTMCTVCLRKQLFVPISSTPLLVPFSCLKLFNIFVSRPNIMYPLSYCYGQYCNILRYCHFDGRKYKLENKNRNITCPTSRLLYSYLLK